MIDSFIYLFIYLFALTLLPLANFSLGCSGPKFYGTLQRELSTCLFHVLFSLLLTLLSLQALNLSKMRVKMQKIFHNKSMGKFPEEYMEKGKKRHLRICLS